MSSVSATAAVQPPDAGPPLAVVINARSGHDDTGERIDTVRRLLDEADRPHELFTLENPSELPAAIDRALAWARPRGGAVVAAGGDGTVNCAARALLASGCPLGLLPQGTFNLFGRTHGIEADTEVATRLLLEARPKPVQIGLVNDRPFLVNASLGLYPKLLEDREAFEAQFGRSQLNALFAGVMTILREHYAWTIELELGETSMTACTSTLFVGNNRLQLERMGIPETDALEHGKLVAVMVKPAGKLTMAGMLLKGALGQLGDAGKVLTFAFNRLRVRPRGKLGRRIKVALDGEITQMTTPITFSVSPRPLVLLVPPPPAPAPTDAR